MRKIFHQELTGAVKGFAELMLLPAERRGAGMLFGTKMDETAILAAVSSISERTIEIERFLQ